MEAAKRHVGKEMQVRLASQIYRRYQEMTSEKKITVEDYVLSEISYKAIDNEPPMIEVAKELMKHEYSTQRKTQVLVWMKDYHSALEEATKACDTDMINLVLMKFFVIADK